MKLTFLGTRGEIDLRTPLHQMHTSLAISYRNCEVMIDCGYDWLERIHSMHPDAIVLTHAHPDHCWGLKNGAPAKVYATEQTWASIDSFPITDRSMVHARKRFEIEDIEFEAFPVQHSTRAPAVGYRVTAGRHTIFYVPDLVYINEVHDALHGIDVYIGDGASLRKGLVRKRGDALLGHAAVRTQLGWCEREGVGRAIITHCGSEIVSGDPEEMKVAVAELGRERNLAAELAYDGFTIVLP